MKKERFQHLLEEQFIRISKLTGTKGEEYSRSDDQLANFKRQAADLGLDQRQIWAVYFNKHIDSIKSYLKTLDDSKLSEPIEGRIDDAILYLILLRAMIVERYEENNAP